MVFWQGKSTSLETCASPSSSCHSAFVLTEMKVLTLVDLFHIPYAFELERLANLNMFQTRPNVARYVDSAVDWPLILIEFRWWNELLARESWKAVAKEIHSNVYCSVSTANSHNGSRGSLK